MHKTFHPVHSGRIFASLSFLVLVSLAVGYLPLAGDKVNLLLIIVAVMMAALVTSQYMGIVGEPHLVWWIIGIPLMLFLLILMVLAPDMVWRLNQGPLTP